MRKILPLLLFTTLIFSMFQNLCFAENISNLNFDSQITGYITETNSSDVYQIDVPKAGRVGIEVMSYINNVNIYVLASDGVTEIVSTDLYTGSENEPKKWTSNIDLEAGIYFIKVKQYNKYTGKYTIKVKHTPINNNDIEPNNSVDAPQKIRFGTNPLTGYLSWSDNVDVYQIDVPKAGRVGIEVMSYINNVNMYVLASDGVTEIVSTDLYTGSENEPKKWTSYIDLEAGIYFIKVKQYNKYTGKYTIKVKHTPINNNDIEPNNSVDAPQKIRFGTNPLTGYLSWSDNVDVYQIDVPKAGRVGIEVMSYINNVNMYVLASDGVTEIVSTDLYTGSENEPKKWTSYIDLEAGIYFIKVKQYNKYTGKYTIKVKHTPINNNDIEPNNNVDQAQKVYFDSKLITGYISWSDRVDVYRFDVLKTGLAEIEVASTIQDLNFSVLSSDGVSELVNRELYYGSISEPKKWTEKLVLKAGIYFIKIKPYNNHTGYYSLKLKDTIPPVRPQVDKIFSKNISITGKAEPNSVITAYNGKTLLGKSKADKAGKYAVKIKNQKEKTIILVYATDNSGNRSTGSKVIVSK